MQNKRNKTRLSLILSMMLIVAMALNTTACSDNKTNHNSEISSQLESPSQTDADENSHSQANTDTEQNSASQTELETLPGIGPSIALSIINYRKENGNFEIIARTEIETKPVVYGTTTVPGKQDYALTGHKYEEQYTSLVQEYSKNITKLRIIKKEYNTEKYLPGVKFNLLNN